MVKFRVGTLRFAHPTKSANSFPCSQGKGGTGATLNVALPRAAREEVSRSLGGAQRNPGRNGPPATIAARRAILSYESIRRNTLRDCMNSGKEVRV